MLGALAGKDECGVCLTRGDARRCLADPDVVVLARTQNGDGISVVGDEGRHAHIVGAPVREGERDVVQWQVLIAREFGGEGGSGVLQRLAGAGREQQDLRSGGNRGRVGGRGRLLHDDVRVGASHTEGTHAGPPRCVRLPGGEGVGDDETGVLEMQFGVGCAVVHRRRDRLVLQTHDRLDQPGDPGCRVEVADVRLHRAQDARAGTVGLGGSERLPQGLDLDRVTQWGAGSVGLDETDRRRVDLGDGLSFGDDFGLT